MHEIHPVALFRYSVLGALVSRVRLERGELKTTIRELAARDYDIPGSRHSRIGKKTIEAWYYAWRRGGIEALARRNIASSAANSCSSVPNNADHLSTTSTWSGLGDTS
jgi:hypothetical protein